MIPVRHHARAAQLLAGLSIPVAALWATASGAPSSIQFILGAAIGSIGSAAIRRPRSLRHTTAQPPDDFEIPVVVSLPLPKTRSIEFDFVSAAVCVGRRVDFDVGREHYAVIAHGIDSQMKDGRLRADIRIPVGATDLSGGCNARMVVPRRHLVPPSSPGDRLASDCIFTVELRDTHPRFFFLWVNKIEPEDRRISFTACSSLKA